MGDRNSVLLPVLPLGEGPQLGPIPPQPPQVVSGSHLGLLGSHEVPTGFDRAVGKRQWAPGGRDPACWGHPMASHPWSPATSPPPAPAPSSLRQLTRPATSWRFNTLIWDLRLCFSHPPRVPGRPHSPSSVPFQERRFWVQSCTPTPLGGSPPAPVHGSSAPL